MKVNWNIVSEAIKKFSQDLNGSGMKLHDFGEGVYSLPESTDTGYLSSFILKLEEDRLVKP